MELNSNNNQLLNNEITGNTNREIFDSTGNSYNNSLIYNNSFGEIRWINDSNNGFLKNLSTIGNIGLTINLSIGNNTVFFNAGAFTFGNINSSANITLYGIDSFGFTDPVIFRNGADCGSDCVNFTALDAAIVKFNVTYAGANYTIGEGAANAAPTINVSSISAITPNESGVNYTVFNFTVTDTDGGADINFSTAEARFQLSGETTRLNTTCINTTGHIGNNLNFTCTVGMYYFDKNDVDCECNCKR